MQDNKVIDALGGGTKVVAALRREFPSLKPIGPHAVYMWKIHGIPQAWRFWVCQLAQQKIAGFDVPAFMGIPKVEKPRKTKRAA